MERVEFASKKAVERFLKKAKKLGFLVEAKGNAVIHRGNVPDFRKFAKAYIAEHRSAAEFRVE